MQNHTAAISPSLANATVRQTSPQFTMQPPSQQQQQQPFAFAQPQRYPGVAYQTPFLQQQQPQPYVNSPTGYFHSMQQQNPHASKQQHIRHHHNYHNNRNLNLKHNHLPMEGHYMTNLLPV